MWLAIDIGNTNTHVGMFEEDVLISVCTIKNESPLQAHFAQALNPTTLHKTQAVVIASVNPKAEAVVTEYLRQYLHTQLHSLGKDIPIPIPILTEYPEKVGVDRLVNALAAFERTKNRTIVIDAGTALTIDAINDKGAFLGGIIAPGMDTSAKALHHYTALLPQIAISKPKNILGKNTEEAIHSGIYWGTIGMVNQLITMIGNELEGQPAVIATGGNGPMLAREIPRITAVLPSLTLEGISIAYKLYLASRTPH